VALQIQGLQALGAILVMLLLLIAVALSSSFPELCVPVVPRLWIFSPQGEWTNKIVRTREIPSSFFPRKMAMKEEEEVKGISSDKPELLSYGLCRAQHLWEVHCPPF
jgi:hypothetical protein